MLQERRNIYTVSLVAIGDFNPVIISPYWLALKGLIGEEEAKEAKVDLIHQEVVNFSLSWVSFLIQKNRFEIKTSQEPFESLLDLFVGIFKYLSETPISRLGINHIMHFNVRDQEESFKIGNILVPLTNWDFLKEPRVLKLEIIDKNRPDNFKGHRQIKIEPSDLITGSQYGISVNFNDDYVIEGKSQSSLDAIRLISSQWKISFDYADLIIKGLELKLF